MKKGLTLIEVMIAVAIIAIVSTAVLNSFGSGLNAMYSSIDISENTSTASSYMQMYLADNVNTEGITINTVTISVNGVNIEMEEVTATKDNVAIKYYK